LTDRAATQQKNGRSAERSDKIAEPAAGPEAELSEAETRTRLTQLGYN
jgi:hypothetical protein